MATAIERRHRCLLDSVYASSEFLPRLAERPSGVQIAYLLKVSLRTLADRAGSQSANLVVAHKFIISYLKNHSV